MDTVTTDETVKERTGTTVVTGVEKTDTGGLAVMANRVVSSALRRELGTRYTNQGTVRVRYSGAR